MKTRLRILVCSLIAGASAACAFGADDASELALLLFNRAEVEAGVREHYQNSFGDHTKAGQIKETVDKYLLSKFAWAELQTLCVAAIRASFTLEEQKQLLSFMKSPAGAKYRSVGVGPTWKGVADLLERENQKLLATVESTVGRKEN